MSHTHREERIGSRYLLRSILAVSSVLVAFLIYISWNVVTRFPSERMTIAIAGNPVYVVSWDDVRGYLTIIAVPADVYLDGVFGVGSLSIASLGTLEALDAKKKGMFAKSLEEALAVPIAGVLRTDHTAGSKGEFHAFVKNALWWGSELSFPLRVRLWWILVGLRPDAVKAVDLESQGVFPNALLADGSTVRVFDVPRYDAVIGNRLEVDSIRREELRIRVVNTTSAPGLGNRAARTLSHAGMVVIAVESEPAVQTSCSIHTKKELRDTKTTAFMKQAFLCDVTQESDEDERADLTIRLGEEYAQRFKSD